MDQKLQGLLKRTKLEVQVLVQGTNWSQQVNDKYKNVMLYSVDYFCVQALHGNTVQEPIQNRFFIFF